MIISRKEYEQLKASNGDWERSRLKMLRDRKADTESEVSRLRILSEQQTKEYKQMEKFYVDKINNMYHEINILKAFNKATVCTNEERELLEEIKYGPNMHMKLYAMLQNYRTGD